MPRPKTESKTRGVLIGLGVLGAIWGTIALVAWATRETVPVGSDAGADDASAAAVIDAAAHEDANDDDGGALSELAITSPEAGSLDASESTDAHTVEAATIANDAAPDASASERGTTVAYDLCAGSSARIAVGVVGRGPAASAVVACRGVAHVVALVAGQPRIVASLDEPDAEAGMFETEARPVIADVTGDGLGDVVVGCARLSERGGPRPAGGWIVAGQRGAVRVGSRVTSLGPATITSLAAAELDGRPGHEILVGHMGNWFANETNEVRVFRGGPRPARLSTIRTDGTESVSVAAADLTEDGHDDLVVAHEQRGGLTVMTGNGAGGFGDARSFPDVQAYGAWRSDFDGDGKPEVLLDTELGFHALSPGRDEILPPSPVSIARERIFVIADVDADRRTDVIVALGTDTWLGPDWWDISVQHARADRSFEVRDLVRSAFHPIDIAVGDLDGDGAPDLAWLGVEREPLHPERDRIVLQLALGITMRAGSQPPREGPTERVAIRSVDGAPTIALR